MIDIFIDDDNKVTIKTTNGLAETEIATAVVLEAMKNLKKTRRGYSKGSCSISTKLWWRKIAMC